MQNAHPQPSNRRPPPEAVRLLATPAAAKTLKKLGRHGGYGGDLQEELARKLAHPEGKIEPKGPGFYGIDLHGGHRAVFTLNEGKQPVMIYFGDHRGYDGLQLRLHKSFNLVSAREVVVSPEGATRTVDIGEFGRVFLESSGFAHAATRSRPRLLQRNSLHI